jgi:hypothetical protein
MNSTIEDANRAVAEVAAVCGHDRAIAVVASFGVTRLADLHPQSYKSLIERCLEECAFYRRSREQRLLQDELDRLRREAREVEVRLRRLAVG